MTSWSIAAATVNSGHFHSFFYFRLNIFDTQKARQNKHSVILHMAEHDREPANMNPEANTEIVKV